MVSMMNRTLVRRPALVKPALLLMMLLGAVWIGLMVPTLLHVASGALGLGLAVFAVPVLLLAVTYAGMVAATAASGLRREYLLATAVVLCSVMLGSGLLHVMLYSAAHGCS
ncbi:hypothetical protein [Deinococcus petrolearius]|uniref:Uncharacterized protein n=1 Tax=Deinococcus petrolearius TaxID=1751295 RepID=A0ABW1DPD1_9DEIO